MASSNKNWPSMFRSKPCHNHHHHSHHQNHQWQHDDIDTMHYSICHSSPLFTSERVPHQKPRWNPKPEQIQILESIFNSGMINPPRDEIKNIRIRLQAYGQVGDANVFYWFQNRKSRTKHKLRLLQASCSDHNNHSINRPNPCVDPVNQKSGLFPTQSKTKPDGFLLPVHDDSIATQVGFDYSDLQLTGDVIVPALTEELHRFVDNTLDTEVAFSDVNNGVNSKIEEHVPEIPFSGVMSSPRNVPLIINQIQENDIFGQIDDISAKSTVFINDMPFEVAVGLFNVRETFGNDAVLINSSGQPILTDPWGVTLHPLQNGAVYYLI